MLFTKPSMDSLSLRPTLTPIPTPTPTPRRRYTNSCRAAKIPGKKGSDESCTFTLKRTSNDETSFGHFIGILIDDKEVDPENYTASPGSVIIELKSAFLETLSPGWHTITALFDDSFNVSTRFEIATEPSNDDDPSDPSADPNDPSAKPNGASAKPSSPSAKPTSSPAKATPTTGDETPAVFLAILALVAGGLLLLATKKRREQ